MLMTDGVRSAPPPRGVLITQDLIFSTKVADTARALGAEVAVASDVERAVGLARERMPGVVILDLGLPEADLAALVMRLREAAGDVPVIAYGPHVDRDRFAAASAAGCDVLPRGRFSSSLPELIRRYLGVG